MSVGQRGSCRCFVVAFSLAQMELYDNQKSANIVPPLHTQKGWEAFKTLKEPFFPLPRKYKYICFDLILFLYALFMKVHTQKKMHSV